MSTKKMSGMKLTEIKNLGGEVTRAHVEGDTFYASIKVPLSKKG